MLGAGQSDLRCSSGRGVMPGGESCGDERGEPGECEGGVALAREVRLLGCGKHGSGAGSGCARLKRGRLAQKTPNAAGCWLVVDCGQER